MKESAELLLELAAAPKREAAWLKMSPAATAAAEAEEPIEEAAQIE